MDVIGWIGALLLALCAFPQALSSWRQGHSRGISLTFLSMWGMGELLVLVYVLPTGDIPLITNYAVNLLLIGVITYYRLRPRM